MRLVCSPNLGSADAAAIYRSIADRSKALADLPKAEEYARKGEGARAFAAWLAEGRVAMQIASPKRPLGMYHEKIGFFVDAEGNRLAISGSANESRTAWSINFERVDLFNSWSSEEAGRRCSQIGIAFEELWRNKTDGLTVLPIHEALLSGIIRVRAPANFADGDVPQGLGPPPSNSPPEVLCPPPTLRLYSHQEAAIKQWAENKGRGILAMATGAGKTLTALSIATRLSAGVSALVVVIVAPYIHLVDQWVNNARVFGLRPIRAAESHVTWEQDLAVAINTINAGQRSILSIAVTQNTLSQSTRFAELLRGVRVPMLIIGDEVHNYGSPESFLALPQRAVYRLGLSATPERHRDPDGTQRIVDYFGPVVFRYELKDAISDEVLTPYRYFPIRVGLDADEIERFIDISRQLARYAPQVESDDTGAGELVKRLLIKRARLLASARNKISILQGILENRREDSHILVYCGDGQVDGPVPEDQQRQIEAAVAIIGNNIGMRCASYTATTPPEKRRELLSLFTEGRIQVLVAIRCLDEGVDVPSTRTAILLASSTNPRQFIQRRGRILRLSEGKTRADLFDMIVCPDISGMIEGSSDYRAIRGMLEREFQRAAEFASLASNGPLARQSLKDITERMHLEAGWYNTTNQDRWTKQ